MGLWREQDSDHSSDSLATAVYACDKAPEAVFAKILISMSLRSSQTFEFENQLEFARIVVPTVDDVSPPFLDELAGHLVELTDDVLGRPHSEKAVLAGNVVLQVDLQPFR